MISHGGTPLKSVLRTITPSSSNNSPSKLALRLDTMKKTIGSLRIRPSPSMAFKKKISFKDDIHAEDFDSNPDVFKKNDLPNLLKTFKYNTESIEKIQRVLEILDIQTSGKESERFQKFIENDIRFEEIFRYVARNIIEKNEYSEFKELLKFAKSAKIHLDDETLEFKVKKDKKGVELERLIQEVAKLKFLKKVISSKLL